MPKKKINDSKKEKKSTNKDTNEKKQSKKTSSKEKTKKPGKPTDLKPLIMPRIVLKASVVSLSAIKTLNDSFGTGTFLMKLKSTPVSMLYLKDKRKTINADTYQVKGLKGMVRHLLMELLDFLGISVCHTTSRKTFGKDGDAVIPKDSFVHPLGACLVPGEEENEESKKTKSRSEGCLIYQIFGAMLEESIIKIDPVLIAQINGQNKTFPATARDFETDREVFYVHAATEARNVMTIDQKPVQDFREGYFDGNFVITIDVSKCTPTQIGALVEALFNAKELGAGKTSGYGRIEINRIELWELMEHREIVLTSVGERGLEPVFKTKKINLSLKLQEACTAWEAYKAANRTIDTNIIAPKVVTTV